MKKALLAFLGIVLALALLELGLHFLAKRARALPETHGEAYTILALGESTTQGAAGFDYASTYTHQLETLFRDRCAGFPVRVVNKGIAGIHSPEIFAALPAWIDEHRPQLVISMIGINDYQLGADALAPKERVTAVKKLRSYKFFEWLFAAVRERAGPLLWPHEIYVHDEPRVILEKMITHGRRIEYEDYQVYFTQRLENEGLSNEEALGVHRKVLEKFPDHRGAMLAAANYERTLGRYREAEKLHLKALELAPASDKSWIRYELAVDYMKAGSWAKVDEIIRTHEPDAFLAFMYASSLLAEGQAARAEKILKSARAAHPHDGRVAYLLAEIFKLKRDFSAMRKEQGARDALFAAESSAVTAYYYQEIASVLESRGIGLVAMQYPMRALEPLRRSLPGFHQQVLFLDNEAPFRAALKNAPYEKIFYDRFAGNFGHMTAEGNRILAENIFSFLRKEASPFRERCREGR